MKLMPVAALLLATAAAPAMAGEVLMLEHNPSVEELRSYLAPDTPRRTRGIEITAQPTAPTMATTQAAATMDAPEPPTPTPEPTTIGYRIQFAYDSADIQAESRGFLDQLGQVLQSEPNLALAVEGHTDATGSAGYNLGLSQRRAAAVQSYLSSVWQVPAERLTVSGKGESEPLTADGNAAENRRVQFRAMS